MSPTMLFVGKRSMKYGAVNAVHRSPSKECHGLDALYERITDSYQRWVAPGEYYFRAVDNAASHHDAIKFNWEMVIFVSGEIASVGFDFLLIDPVGKITSDYQFVEQ